MNDAGTVRDLDFHPHETTIRVFSIPSSGVLRLDGEVFVAETRHGDTVFRHYGFANEWFKVNVTLDRQGRFTETPAGPEHTAFAFNCDVATPMRRSGPDVFGVDLFADVLVRSDGRSYTIKDENELEQAADAGLVSPHEFAAARVGLARLVALIEAGALIPYLDGVCPFCPSAAPEGLRMTRLPLADAPAVQPERRWSWCPPVQ